MVSTREQWVDEARGFALILVVLGHMGITFFGQFFTTCHLPIFYFLSGYLFSVHGDFGVFIKKKAKRLLIPYFFFGAILIVCSMIFNGSSFDNLIVKFLLQKRMFTLWFLTSLFFVNVLFYILYKLLKQSDKKNLYLLGISLLLFIVGAVYYKHGGGALFWNIDTLLIVPIWFAAGIACRESSIITGLLKASKLKLTLLALLFAVVYIALVYLNWVMSKEKLDIAMCSVGLAPITLVASFAGIGMFVFISILVHIPVVDYLGKNTMVYFALHQSMILPLISMFYSYFGLFTNESLISDIIRLIVSVLLIFISLYPIDRLLSNNRIKFLIGK